MDRQRIGDHHAEVYRIALKTGKGSNKGTKLPKMERSLDLQGFQMVWVERFESLVLYDIWYYCITNSDNTSKKFSGIGY